MKDPSVAVVIPNYNSGSIFYRGRPILLSCLSSFRKTGYSNYRIIIADNHSTDASRKIASHFRGVEFLEKKTREEFSGIPRTNNYGIKYALRKYRPDYILMYNTDMLVGQDRQWLRKLVGVAEGGRDIGIVGCKLLFPGNIIQHAGMIVGPAARNRGWGERDEGQYDKIEDVPGVTAALSLIRSEVFAKAGFFDERFYNGFDDTDFCIRVRREGYRIVYDGEASIVHFEGYGSSNSPDRRVKDKSFYGYQTSYVYFALKDLNWANRIVAVALQLGRSIAVWKENCRPRCALNLRFRDRVPWRLKTSIKAILDAWKLYKGAKR